MALSLVILFVVSSLSPLAAAVTIETQFKDGTTSYEHTFMGTGVGSAGDITIPYGAYVTQATFDLEGRASTSTWSNLTSDSDFGGAGSSSWLGTPPGMQYGWRTNLEVENGDVHLKTQPTDRTSTFSSPTHVGDIGDAMQNTTGQFIALSDQGFKGVTYQPAKKSLASPSNVNWNYPGPIVNLGDEIHVMMRTSTSMIAPQIQRYNSTTGSHIGNASISYGSCSLQSLYYTYDATSDGNNTAWVVSYSYRYVSKWTISSSGDWSCSQYWTMSSPYFPLGISVDSVTNDLYLVVYESMSPNYYHNLWQVSRSFPTTANVTYTLGSNTKLGGLGAGLVVEGDRVTYNKYASNFALHNYFDIGSGFAEHLGSNQFNQEGHYGLENMRDGTYGYVCYYQNSCSTLSKKLNFVGSGVTFDERSVSTTSAIVKGNTYTLSTAANQVSITEAVAHIPDNTSIEYEISVDNGVTWKRASLGSSVIFAQAGNRLLARAYLNGTTTQTPVLDMITLTYVDSYVSSGYFYIRKSYGGTTVPVAATIWWNDTTPSGTSLTVRIYSGSSCSGTVHSFSYPGETRSISATSWLSVCVNFGSGSGSSETPVLHDINIQFHSNAPKNVGLDIGGDGTKDWSEQGLFLGKVTVSDSDIVNALNSLIPNTGAGTIDIPIELVSNTAGIMLINSFSITYQMSTVNLDINYDESEILHERIEPYEVVTRHVIGETTSAIDKVKLQFNAMPLGMAPLLEWDLLDMQPSENDPEDWISVDPSSYTNISNGILEVHWRFKVKSDFPEQSNVRFTTGCEDNNEFSPTDLPSTPTLLVNHSYGLGWLKVIDNDGAVTWGDMPENNWVAAGETIHFQGQMFFQGTNDTPKDNAFDVRIAQGTFVHSSWRDLSNNDGTFFISVDVPTIDVPNGISYEVQTFNERDPTRVLPADATWFHTIRVDATTPKALETYPLEGSYEAADAEHLIRFHVADAVGSPVTLDLNYWVEADHDDNRNGLADAEEYEITQMVNNTEGEDKWFFAEIDDSRNPNMAKVSYFISGNDPAGNVLKHNIGVDAEGEVVWAPHGPGFGSDTATFLTRRDSKAVFTGLDWLGHFDESSVFAGQDQTIMLGLIDANTVIDFEYISLVFDFEGPDPAKDRQVISYSGFNDTFWSESEYLTLSSSSFTETTTNASGMPWILVTFNFQFSWDWPDEEYGDLALLFKERGEADARVLVFADYTFKVENDLVLSPGSFLISDVSEPRTGPIADGSRVRANDRLAFTGRVVYEGSNTPAPRNLGVKVEVFDGLSVWSDGSFDADGAYNVEVPLSSAQSLATSETRVCLISITEIPGLGEDMTGNTVATTLRVIVDHTPPRVTHRYAPIDVIDISESTDLTRLAVAFNGTEDADLTGSAQFVNWVMRDHTNTLTIASGMNILGIQQEDNMVRWSGTVDLTSGGTVVARSGDLVGFWITGYDAAGNPFHEIGNSEANPISELPSMDGDNDLSWVKLGAEVTELAVIDIAIADDHISHGSKVSITATIHNYGGATGTSFSVAFYAGDNERAFHTSTLNGIDSSETITITAEWRADDSVERITVIVDPENVISEVDEDDNRAEHSVEVVYVSYMGWLDSPREQPLAWVFTILSIIVLSVVFTIARRTSLASDETSLFDELGYDEDGDFDEDAFEDYDDDDDDYDDDDY
jgi:hypothetical protein